MIQSYCCFGIFAAAEEPKWDSKRILDHLRRRSCKATKDHETFIGKIIGLLKKAIEIAGAHRQTLLWISVFRIPNSFSHIFWWQKGLIYDWFFISRQEWLRTQRRLFWRLWSSFRSKGAFHGVFGAPELYLEGAKEFWFFMEHWGSPWSPDSKEAFDDGSWNIFVSKKLVSRIVLALRVSCLCYLRRKETQPASSFTSSHLEGIRLWFPSLFSIVLSKKNFNACCASKLS